MHVNLRRYAKLGAPRQTIERSVRDELIPELKKQQGFKGYCVFNTDDGGAVSISVFDTEDAANRSADKARRWIMRHRDFFPERGEEFSGDCIAHDASRGREQRPDDGQDPFHVLVRELENVGDVDLFRTFARREAHPLIAQAEGFRGFYAVSSNRNNGRAAVITLFDNEQNAVKCHEQAMQVLNEGLPDIKVARAVHGHSVIMASGD